MAETPLASTEDVAALLGRDLTDSEGTRLTGILVKASALFRREAQQNFTPGTSAVRLKVNGGEVYLPQRPVVAVTSVVDDDSNAVSNRRRGQWLVVDLGSDRFVTVTYSHGAAEVPDLVRWTVAEVGMKVLNLATAAVAGASAHSETRGPFAESTTYASWAIGGQAALSPEDVALARSFRPVVPTIYVQPSAIAPSWCGPDALDDVI